MRLKRLSALGLACVIAAGVTLTGCGSVDPEATVATINGREIPLGVANFAAQFTAVDYDTYYLSYLGTDMWSQDIGGNGETMTDSVKNNILETLEEYCLLDQHMGDYGVELTEEELADIESAAAQFIADNSAQALEALGATEEYVSEFLRLNTLQSKMRAAMVADVDRNVPDEECAQKTFSYVRVSKAADSDDEEQTEEQAAAAAKETAEKILTAAMTGSQEDALEAAAEDADKNKSTCSYGTGDLNEEDNSTSLELEVLQAADKLDEGEFAKELIETDDSYYIVRMDSLFDEDATEKERQSIISERENDRYEEIVNGYKETSDWTVNEDVWEPVNFATIYTKAQSQTDTNETVGE